MPSAIRIILLLLLLVPVRAWGWGNSVSHSNFRFSLSEIRPTIAEKAIRRARQPEILPQGLTFVIAPEDAAPLQLRDNAVDEIIEAAGHIREHDVEPVAAFAG